MSCTLSIGGRANKPELPGNRSSPRMSMQAVENFKEKSLLCMITILEPKNPESHFESMC